MKKILLASLILIGASNVNAQSISCNLDILVADKGGYLMPSKDKLILATKLNDEASFTLDNCEKINLSNLQISLCASEAQFVGGYNIATIIQTGNEEEFLTISTKTLATLRAREELTEVFSEKSVLNSFQAKMSNAGINSPSVLGNDSFALDEAVKEGMSKGILTPNEPVVVSIGNCQLNK